MPTITRITAQKRAGRYNIDLDGEYAFPVAESTLIKYMLAKDVELTDEQVAELKHEDEGARAFSRALSYLASTPRTVHQVQEYLRGKEFADDAIDVAVTRLTDLHYLNDVEYVHEFVSTNQRGGDRGPGAIRRFLVQRGVDSNIIDDELANQSAAQELEVARRVANKVLRSPGSRSFNALIQHAQQTMMTKGFGRDVINAAIEAEAPEQDEEREDDLLRAAAEKVWTQKRNFDGYERRMKVKQTLYRKGFDLDAIDRVLDDIEDGQ